MEFLGVNLKARAHLSGGQRCLNLGGTGQCRHGTQSVQAASRGPGRGQKWPFGLVLLSPAAGSRTRPECPQEGVTSLRGVLLDSRLQLQPGCFAMSFEKTFIPGSTEEQNAPCQQGCG